MIPTFTETGLLPDGIHDCTLDEAEARFGRFQGTDGRPRLWAKFKEFVRDAKGCGLVVELIVNGSFVTDKPNPNDIDLIVVLSGTHSFAADLNPSEYNVLSKKRVRRRFGFDIVLARANTDDFADTVDFFRQVRNHPNQRKGLLRIKL